MKQVKKKHREKSSEELARFCALGELDLEHPNLFVCGDLFQFFIGEVAGLIAHESVDHAPGRHADHAEVDARAVIRAPLKLDSLAMGFPPGSQNPFPEFMKFMAMALTV